MHVVFVAPERYPVPPAGGNSVEIYTWHLARSLAARATVTIISRQWPGLPRRETRDGVLCLRVPGGPPTFYGRHAAALLRRLKADIVQLENRPRLLPLLRPACPGARLVLNLHSMNFMPAGAAVRACLRHADAVIANSRYVRRVLLGRFPEVRGRAHVLHPGADVTRFHPVWSDTGQARRQVLRGQLGLSDEPVVLYVGRVIPRKGVDLLLAAMRRVRARHPTAQLLVVGGKWAGKQQPWSLRLARLAAPLGSAARALGNLRHDRLPDIYAAADCLVCPSQEPEALGLVNLEAMAAGLPVAASSAWGIPEVVQDGSTGVLVKAYRSPEALADAVTGLLDNPQRARQFGENGRRLVEDYFNWERAGRDAESIYRAVLATTAKRRRSGEQRGQNGPGHWHPDDGTNAPEHASPALP